MKTLYTLLLSALILFTGCKNEEKTATEPESTTDPAQTITDSPESHTPNGHNSSNSLDWAGTYIGTLPCGDCPGIQTVIKINDNNTYEMSSVFLDKKSEPVTAKGSFAWDETGSIITLDAYGDHLKYKVQEGSLKQLDKFGDDKQGPDPEKYILKKE